jgi:hypothetical protein
MNSSRSDFFASFNVFVAASKKLLTPKEYQPSLKESRLRRLFK